MRARTVGVLVVAVAAALAGCGGRVSYDEPWAEAPDGVSRGTPTIPIVPGELGGGGAGGDDGGDDTSTATVTPTSSGTVTVAPVAECEAWYDCPDATSECMLPECVDGSCTEAPAPNGSLCTGDSPSGQAVCADGVCGG